MAPRDDESVKVFLSIGLDDKTASTTINNPKVTANLTAVIHEAGVTDGCDRTTGNLLYTVATKYHSNLRVHRPTLLNYIVSSKVSKHVSPSSISICSSCFIEGKLANVVLILSVCRLKLLHNWKLQFRFLDKNAPDDFKLNEFEEACGVGVEVSQEDIEKAAQDVFEENKSSISEKRYRTNG
ncbi:unnamed protein product [Eruca vesicaria subsp. sativa]|uniref:Glutaminyl-tRNA synthetase class Ib non-specific RNA-binding domain-containing protein n=1 Tax=Eruca vesicaria subsp. sativa TaxID=29727 RepID=A0ABC8J0J7_ERUVS|nr:unnamed protein product [Eruca vesicaria subsp. sativa]